MKLGILGGIGPVATGNFYLNLIRKLQQSGKIKCNSDFPQIIINSIPALELLGKRPDFTAYQKGTDELNSFGVDIIFIVCNTANLFPYRSGAKIADLRALVKKRISNMKQSSIVVLGSRSITKLNDFCPESTTQIKLCEKDRVMIEKSIRDINLGRNICLDGFIEKFEGSLVVLACTELSQAVTPSANILDTMDILCEEAAVFALSSKI